MESYYSLQKYSGPASRLTCPSCRRPHCFALYVDDDGNPLDESVGRCDHESSCGYHYTPKSFIKDHPEAAEAHHRTDWRIASPELRKRLRMANNKVYSIPMDYALRSVRTDILSDFVRFLLKLFDVDIVEHLIADYLLGVTKQRQVIFFQIDTEGRLRTGKIMKYDSETGHRIKDEAVSGRIGWIHSILMKRNELPSDWQLTQCLFGEHLLRKYPDKPVCVVESEKSAIICAGVMPQCVWVATGGKGQLNCRLNILKGRKVTLWPDIDGVEEWKMKAKEFASLDIMVADIFQCATEEDRRKQIDIADILIRSILSGFDSEPLRRAISDAPSKEDTITDTIKRCISAQDVAETLQMVRDLDLTLTSVKRTQQYNSNIY